MDKDNKANEDIIDAVWVTVDDKEKFDDHTLPIIDLYYKSLQQRSVLKQK